MHRTSIHQALADRSGARYAPRAEEPSVKPPSIGPLPTRSCCVWISQQLFEKIFQAAGLLCQVEVADNISSALERVLPPQFLVLHQAEDGLSQGRGIALGYQQTRLAISHRFRDSAAERAYHGKAHRLGLDEHHTE